MSDVDDLRQQLRDRGYLTHGIERWFALDPWSSRAFWLELVTVALKAAVLIAAFGSLAPTAVMLARNSPLSAIEIFGIFTSYAAVWLVAAFAFVVMVALILKLRPSLPIDTPRALLAISLVVSALLVAPIAIWWYRFDTGPTTAELIAGIALSVVFFLVATVVVSAALLSFSIYELQRIPTIHSRSRTIPMAVAAAVLIALLFVPAYAERERAFIEPMVVTSPSTRRVALIAVDGLTWEIAQSRPDLAKALPHAMSVRPVPGSSTTERWASLGTGVRTEAHGVRAIEGIRFRGGSHVMQRVSRGDIVLMDLAPLARIARREPLPPTVRKRDYVWEIFAERGVTSVAVNWWATSDVDEGALTTVSPELVFIGAGIDPLKLDAIASDRFLAILTSEYPRFATVYLPTLDVILNRVELDRTTQLANSIRALDGVVNTIALVRARGYDVVLAGMPGDRQSGSAVVASTIPLRAQTSWDVAPAILDILGFPASSEMPGGTSTSRIASYGPRAGGVETVTMNEEYYENLKSLGYIR